MTAKRDQPQVVNAPDWISKGDASRLRGVSRQAIWDLVNRGRLTTCVIAGRIYVSRSEVLNFTRRPRGPAGTGYVKGKTVKRKKTKPPNPSKWVYVVEAARETGLPRLAIVDLVRRGRIRKIVNAGKTFVSRAGVEDFMRQQRTTNRS